MCEGSRRDFRTTLLPSMQIRAFKCDEDGDNSRKTKYGDDISVAAVSAQRLLRILTWFVCMIRINTHPSRAWAFSLRQ